MRRSLQAGKPIGTCFDSSTWNISQTVQTALSLIRKWRQNAKTRKQLDGMPAYMLRDIGLTESQVRAEMQKKFWQ
jgi:uncharacterized protein YjiS (DUF1127 family)